MTRKTLTFTETIKAEPAEVYYALTNPDALTQWLCNDARLQLQTGGRLYMFWNEGYYVNGEFKDVEADKKIAFSWHGRDEAESSLVTVQLAAQDGGTAVELQHGELLDNDDLLKEINKGWQNGLANLKSILETGLDQRVFERPFMGIYISGQITAEQAEANGWSIAGGVQINGALPKTGAADLGLQDQDIVTHINGKDILTMNDMGEAMQSVKTGDTIPFHYFRDGETHQVEMTLKPRPAPEVPDTAAALAEALEKTFAELDQELDQIFEGVTEAEASLAPGDGEWNTKQVLAHLILTERFSHDSAYAAITGSQPPNWPGNGFPQIDAVIAVSPTKNEMIAAFKHAEAETAALIANLPDNIVARKYLYLPLAQLILGLSNHTRGHFQQIREAIAAARQEETAPAA